MSGAITEALAFAPIIAFSPLPIIAIILLLGTPRAHINAPAFLAGWILGLCGIGVLVLLLDADAGDGEPDRRVAVATVILGGLALVLAVVEWRRRPRPGRPPELPWWMRKLDGFGSRASLLLAVLLSAGNPKNVVPAVGGAAAIAQAGLEPGGEAIALAVFVLAGSLGVALPVAIYFARRERAGHLLLACRTWLVRRGAVIVSVLLVVIGAKLIYDGVADL